MALIQSKTVSPPIIDMDAMETLKSIYEGKIASMETREFEQCDQLLDMEKKRKIDKRRISELEKMVQLLKQLRKVDEPRIFELEGQVETFETRVTVLEIEKAELLLRFRELRNELAIEREEKQKIADEVRVLEHEHNEDFAHTMGVEQHIQMCETKICSLEIENVALSLKVDKLTNELVLERAAKDTLIAEIEHDASDFEEEHTSTRSMEESQDDVTLIQTLNTTPTTIRAVLAEPSGGITSTPRKARVPHVKKLFEDLDLFDDLEEDSSQILKDSDKDLKQQVALFEEPEEERMQILENENRDLKDKVAFLESALHAAFHNSVTPNSNKSSSRATANMECQTPDGLNIPESSKVDQGTAAIIDPLLKNPTPKPRNIRKISEKVEIVDEKTPLQPLITPDELNTSASPKADHDRAAISETPTLKPRNIKKISEKEENFIEKTLFQPHIDASLSETPKSAKIEKISEKLENFEEKKPLQPLNTTPRRAHSSYRSLLNLRNFENTFNT